MPTETQTVAAGENFDGTAGKGLWQWADLDSIPRTTRVVLTCESLATGSPAGEDPPPPLSQASWFFRRRVLIDPQNRIILDRADASAMVDPESNLADRTICGRVVPRDLNGEHWELVLFTKDGEAAMSAHVDYVVQPFPDTSDRDPP